MKKSVLILSYFFAFIFCSLAQPNVTLPVNKVKIDTAKTSATLEKIDTGLKVVSQLDVQKANSLIDMTTMDDSTKQQVKDIIGDVPEAAKQADEIVKIIQGKENYSSKLEYFLYLIGAIVTFLTFLAGLVKKVRALPYYFSPIYWFEKLTGKNHAKLNGKKGTYKHVFIPEGSEIKVEPKA